MYQLDKGIFLEDKNKLLKWDERLGNLADDNRAEVIKQADRLIINWGTHKILDGLTLDLSNNILGTPNFILDKPFFEIESYALGDNESVIFFESTSKHLIKRLGPPTEKAQLKDDREKLWLWNFDHVDITLTLTKQNLFSSHLTIDKAW